MPVNQMNLKLRSLDNTVVVGPMKNPSAFIREHPRLVP